MIGARKLNLILAQSATPDAVLGGPRRSSGDTLRVLSPQTLLITAWQWACGRAPRPIGYRGAVPAGAAVFFDPEERPATASG
jgi:hypothetical protein